MNKLFFAISCVVLLAGCKQQPVDYEYLMTHPHYLEQALNTCETSVKPGDECDVVKRAADDFTALVNEYSSSQEDFGRRVLAAETQLGQTESDLKAADVSHQTVLKQSYQDQKQKLQVLLAVIAAINPQ
jgi:phage-related tail protein